jgi:two-component system, chemotaxis family, chemotaxis protein CheY
MPQKRTSVLIVDDNDMMRSILRGILRGEAYEVVGEARTGSIAIELAGRLHPKIICLDVMMPEMDGLEALPAIKAAHPEIQIVMITSNADPETVQESIRNGASGYIVKPFNAAKVLDTLDKCVSRRRPRQSST